MSSLSHPSSTKPHSMRWITATVGLGGTLEMYDFMLYGSLAGVIFATQYFGPASQELGTLLAFATFAIGFLVRPLGAVVLGHIADRKGRRLVLVLTMTFLGFATLGIGLLPTYAAIGLWAPIILIFFRMLQGVGYSGELGAMASASLEYAPKNRRGFYSGLIVVSSPLGAALAIGMVALLSSTLGEAFANGGWRIGFLIGGLAAFLGLYIRSRLNESPEFLRLVEAKKLERLPIKSAFQKNRTVVVAGTFLSLGMNAIIYLFLVFMIVYPVQYLGFTVQQALTAVAIAVVFSIIPNVFAAFWLDRVNVPRFIMALGAAELLLTFPLFAVLSTGGFWAFVACGMVLNGLNTAIWAAFPMAIFNEVSVDSRFSGGSVAYQLGATIGGGLTPLALTALVLVSGGSVWVIATYCACAAAIIVICAGVLSARRTRSVEEELEAKAVVQP